MLCDLILFILTTAITACSILLSEGTVASFEIAKFIAGIVGSEIAFCNGVFGWNYKLNDLIFF